MEGDDDDDKTPGPEANGGFKSAEAIMVANVAIALHTIAGRCGEAARNLDRLTGAERTGYLAALADSLGDLGDVAHDARRAVRAIAKEESET